MNSVRKENSNVIYDSIESFNTYMNEMLPRAIMGRLHSRIHAIDDEYADSEAMKGTVDKLEKMITDYPNREKAGLRRSKLMWLVGKMYGVSEEEMLLPAVAIELSQDAILIADDIEDGALLRRGDKALQRKYGVSNAINVSHYLNKEVWLALEEYTETYGKSKGRSVRKILDRYADKTLEGQTMELEFSDLETLTFDMCERLLKYKTAGYSTAAPALIGATMGTNGLDILGVLEDIGIQIGMSFQIRDDIEDIEEDVYKGTPTLLIYKAYTDATLDEKEKLRAIYESVNDRRKEGYTDARLREQDFNYVLDMMKKYGSLEYARQQKDGHFDRAKELLLKNIGNGIGKAIPDNKFTSMIAALYYDYANGLKKRG